MHHVGHEASRQRREPEGTVLYRVVSSEWATSQAQLAANERYVPRFCRHEDCRSFAVGAMHVGDADVAQLLRRRRDQAKRKLRPTPN